MSTAPPSQPAQPAASSSSSGSTAAPTHQQSSQTAAQSQSKAQKFAVAEIPPFRANYAQAAGGKSKPTSAANSGTATPAPVMNGSQAASPSASPVPPRNAWGSNGTHARQPSVAAAPAQPASTAAAPAAPAPASKPKAQPAADAAPKPAAGAQKLDFHSFFTGPGASAPAPASRPVSAASPPPAQQPAASATNGLPDERRSMATFDGPARSPQPMQSTALPHAPTGMPLPPSQQQQLSSSSRPFSAGSQQFVPPPMQASGSTSPFQAPSPHPPPFIPQFAGAKSPQPQFAPQQHRPGTNPGAPTFAMGQMPVPPRQGPTPHANVPSRPSFTGGPQSPRASAMPLQPGQPGPMYYPGGWQQQGYPYPGQYYPYPNPAAQLPHSQPPSIATSGASTPSTNGGGLRTPAAPTTSASTSPAAQYQPLPSAPPFTPASMAPTSIVGPTPVSMPPHFSPALRAQAASPTLTPVSRPGSSFRLGAAGVPEFSPSRAHQSPSVASSDSRPTDSPATALPFMPARKSAAIPIKKPPTTPSKPAAPATPAAAPSASAGETPAPPAPEPAAAKKAEPAPAAAAAPAAPVAEAKAAEPAPTPAPEQEKAKTEEPAKAPAEPEAKPVEVKPVEEKPAAPEPVEKEAKAEEVKAKAAEPEVEKAPAAPAVESKDTAKSEPVKPAPVPAVEGIKSAAASRPPSSRGDSAASTAPSTPGEEVAGHKLHGAEAAAIRREEIELLAEEKLETANVGEKPDEKEVVEEAKEEVVEAAKVDDEKPAGEDKPADEGKADADEAEPSKPEVSQQESLSKAHKLESLDSVFYPASVKAPNAEINKGAKPGHFRYDRDFLLQFCEICTDKPESLPKDLDALGMVDIGGRRGPGGAMGPPPAPQRGAMASGFGGRMGSFGLPHAPMTSEERFARSNQPGGAAGGRGGRAAPISRTPSQTGPILGANFAPASGRAERASGRGRRRGAEPPKATPLPADVAPLEQSANRWVPQSTAQATTNPDSPEVVHRKVKALLNKLTVERFDSISEQILEWANKSAKDGVILSTVIQLIFEKATDEANWSSMYAKLCQKLQAKLSMDVMDERLKDQNGDPVRGGPLFRKYLLNRCQEDYEAGWKQKEQATAAASSKAAEDSAKKAANEAAKEAAGDDESKEQDVQMLSEEYYTAQKAKRRGLGLVKFIGELFLLGMLTANIMHVCIKKLLHTTDDAEEEDIESLCRLMTTVGKLLDNERAKKHIDIYFLRMAEIRNNEKVSSRARFMIMDVEELRRSGWQPRHDNAGPKRLSEIHDDARKQDEANKRAASSGGRGMPTLHDQMSRHGSRRGQGRDGFGVPAVNADGWSQPVQTRPEKAGNLSGFGKLRNETSSISLGPSGHFAKGSKQAKEEKQKPGASNPFAALESHDDAPEQPERQKLQLAPRTKPVEGEQEDKPEQEEEDDGAIPHDASSMSTKEAERRADNSVKEFFSVKDISEGVASIEALPAEYRHILIKAIADAAVDKREADVSLTRTLFSEAVRKEIVSHQDMTRALEPIVCASADLMVDIPSLPKFLTSLLSGAGVSRDELKDMCSRMDSEEDVEDAQEKLLAAWDKMATAA